MTKAILKTYSQLNQEQRAFANTKKVDASMKMKHWFDFMVPLAQMDRINDEERRKKKNRIGWTIAGMVLSLILTFVFIPFVVVLIGLTLILILLIKKLKTLKQLDIGNHLRLFMMPFLIVIKEECDREAKGRIKLDASNPVVPQKLTNTIHPSNKGLPQITTRIYTHPWLDAEFVMADGTGLQLEFTDFVQVKNVKKRGSSGKIKYKTKTKIKHRLEAKLMFKKDQYSLATVNPAYQYTDSGDYHAFKAKFKRESLSVEQSIPIEDVLGMIAGAYQNVKLINQN